MSLSRFWRSIGTFCYVVSGVFVVALAFQSVKARFFPHTQRLSSDEEHSQSVVIMGIGSRFIAPTRVELRNIEGALHNSPTLLSHILRISGKKAVTVRSEANTAP